VTTSVTTVTLDEESTGILSSHERSIIRKTWDQAKKDGDVAPQVLYRYVFSNPITKLTFQKLFFKLT
jgi:hypothetical protein